MQALRGLVDYAGLFPPAQLDVPRAVDEYRTARAGPHAWMLGRFIVPLTVLAANVDALRELPLSVIAGIDSIGGVAALRAVDALVELLEVPPALELAPAELRESLERNGVADITTYVELPRGEDWNAFLPRVLPELSRCGLRAKLRCGGLTADAFPSVDEVADFITATCAAGVPFKATAGLHHPIRHRDEATGFTMHGFLNLLAAAAFAPSVDSVTLRAMVAEEDATAFSLTGSGLHWRGKTVDEETLAATRRERFVSYGSCSFEEPVDDLIALGVLCK